MIVTEREREAETQAEGEAGSMHQEADVGFNPGSPGSCPGPKAGAKPLRHPGIPTIWVLIHLRLIFGFFCVIFGTNCIGFHGFFPLSFSLSSLLLSSFLMLF